MKKFIKENWFKLFLCISIVYYFLIFIPQTKKLAEERQISLYNQEQNQKCATAGLEFFRSFKKDSDNVLKSSGLMPDYFEDPKYHFNNNLKTCLVEISYTIFWMDSDTFVSLIRDVYSNKLIITSTWSADGKISRNLSYEEYKKQADKLMSE